MCLTAKVIWGRGQGLMSHPTNWKSRGLIQQPLVYKASGVSTTPQRLLVKIRSPDTQSLYFIWTWRYHGKSRQGNNQQDQITLNSHCRPNVHVCKELKVIIFYFSIKIYVVGFQKNRLHMTELLSTPNKCKLFSKSWIHSNFIWDFRKLPFPSHLGKYYINIGKISAKTHNIWENKGHFQIGNDSHIYGPEKWPNKITDTGIILKTFTHVSAVSQVT